MSETTSEIRVRLATPAQRDELSKFVGAFSYRDTGPFEVTPDQKKILADLPTSGADQLISEDWWKCEYADVRATGSGDLEFVLEAGLGRHQEVIEPLLWLIINGFRAAELLCLTDDSSTGEMLVTWFDGMKLWRYETGGDDDWDESLYGLREADRRFDQLLDLLQDGLPVAADTTGVVARDESAQKSLVDVYYELQLESPKKWVKKLKKLVEAGADVNLPDRDGQTLLSVAIDEGKVGLAKFLLEHGADPNAQDPDGLSALHGAVIEENLGLVEVLLEHGAEVDPRDPYDRTPFLLAAGDGLMEIARLLASKGADIHVTDRENENSLHSILHCEFPFPEPKQIEVMKWLIEEGVDIHLKGRDGLTPASLAAGHLTKSAKEAFEEAVSRK